MSEPDRYTVDAMLQNLAKNSSQQNHQELVKLDDGTEVLRVRKRKRRNQQTAKKSNQENRYHLLRVVLLVGLFFSVGITAGVLLLYGNSAVFRKSLLEKIEGFTGAKVEMIQFRMNPLAARIGSLSFQWPDPGFIDSGILHGLEAKIHPRSFFGSIFGGEECHAALGNIQLRASESEDHMDGVNTSGALTPFAFSRYSISSLDLLFGKNASLTKTQFSSYPNTLYDPTRAEIRFYGGDFQLLDWPAMRLDRGVLSVNRKTWDISSIRFVHEQSDKKMNDVPVMSFKSLKPSSWNIQNLELVANVENFPLDTLLGEELDSFLVGNVYTQKESTKNRLNLDFKSPDSADLVMNVSGANTNAISLNHFYFLRLLSKLLESSWYLKPEFHHRNSLQIQRIGKQVTVSDIDLMENERLAIRGSLKNHLDGRISGNLKIGLPEILVLETEDDLFIKMFSKKKGNFVWVDLEISGTSQKADDDFLSIYKSFSEDKERVIVPKSSEDRFEDLIQGE